MPKTRMRMLLLGTLLCSTAHAKQPSAAELARAIDRLAVTGSVLYVAAHPDDENTRLIAWLANEKLVRAAYLSLTRGEGGQNLIGSEQAPLLGVIRTQELLAARAVDGGEQLFTNVRDFGYSKSPEETLAIWGHDAALADVVLAIRKLRPDVIVTRFPPDGRDTHGHHTASAMLAKEAFRAAADGKQFPEAGAPWQAKRVVWNRGIWPGMPLPDDISTFVKMDVGGYNAVLGASYGELAATSRSMHKSQGFGVAPNRGPVFDYFKLLDGEPMKSSFLDGVELSWRRVKGAEKVTPLVQKARADFRLDNPAAAIPALLEAEHAVAALADDPIKSRKLDEIRRVIAACAGLHAEANAADSVTMPGAELKVTATAINRSAAPVEIREVRFAGERVPVGKPLAANQPLELEHVVRVPADAPLSHPYYLREPPAAGRWTVAPNDLALSSLPSEPPPLTVEWTVAIGGQAIAIEQPVVYRWVDPVAGERWRPIEILPPVTLQPSTTLLLFPDARPKELTVRVHASAGATEGTFTPQSPAGWRIEPPSQKWSLAKKSDEVELRFRVTPPAGESSGTLELGGRALQRIEYPHIPIQTLTPPAQVRLVRAEVKRGGARIGYIPGAGDEVPRALEQAGYAVTLLSDEALAHDPLKFDAIVIGVRAFNVNDKLARFHEKLMSFVAAGGTLVAQYNTANRLSKISVPIGPHPFAISQDRVTEENAAIELLDPKHPLFNLPNKIEPKDFAGWVQERGLYFAGEWDKNYTPLLSMHDTGEPARKGALIYARHGKGAFVYTGLAFFRQLPVGVPGAFRLFANLLAHH